MDFAPSKAGNVKEWQTSVCWTRAKRQKDGARFVRSRRRLIRLENSIADTRSAQIETARFPGFSAAKREQMRPMSFSGVKAEHNGPKAEAGFSRECCRNGWLVAGSRISEGRAEDTEVPPNSGRLISEADVTGFPGQGRTCSNCEMGIPAASGGSVSTGSARKPQAESGFGVRFGPRIQRSDLTGHSRDCEPARFIRPGSPGYSSCQKVSAQHRNA